MGNQNSVDYSFISRAYTLEFCRKSSIAYGLIPIQTLTSGEISTTSTLAGSTSKLDLKIQSFIRYLLYGIEIEQDEFYRETINKLYRFINKIHKLEIGFISYDLYISLFHSWCFYHKNCLEHPVTSNYITLQRIARMYDFTFFTRTQDPIRQIIILCFLANSISSNSLSKRADTTQSALVVWLLPLEIWKYIFSFLHYECRNFAPLDCENYSDIFNSIIY